MRITEQTLRRRQQMHPAGTARSNAISNPIGTKKPPAHRASSLEQSLEALAASEIWSDPDSFSETGYDTSM
jgi:hypothetical protein